jgi:hypothetical protein
MYLVVMRLTSDDVPAFLTPDRQEAFRVAGVLVKREGRAEWLEMDWPESSFSHVSVITFDGGHPVREESAGPSLAEELGGVMGDEPGEY